MDRRSVKEAEQREQNEDVSTFHPEHCFIFWSFLKRIPNYRFFALPDCSICAACDICYNLVYLSADRRSSILDRITTASMHTAQTLSLQRVGRHDVCDSNVTRSRGSFLELQHKSQSRESACVFLLVECSPHATGSSHMADQ